MSSSQRSSCTPPRLHGRPGAPPRRCSPACSRFPLASKAGQEKLTPTTVAQHQVVHCHTFIEGSVSPSLHSPLRPLEKKSEEENPYNGKDPGGQILPSAPTTGLQAPYRQTAATPTYPTYSGASPSPISTGVAGENGLRSAWCSRESSVAKREKEGGMCVGLAERRIIC
jgi:hypothetical protein